MTVLNKGENVINLIPRNSAFIEEIEVQELSDKKALEFKLENMAEDGNRRPWITFVLVDLPLKSVTANVTTKWRFRDSDDVKLIVDNEIQKNKLSIFHKNWLWAGSIFKKLFQNETQTKTIEINLAKGLHYIEFWADRMPVVREVVLDLEEKIFLSLIYKNGIKKENNNIIRLWTAVLILLLPTFLLFGQNATSKTNTLKTLIMDSFTKEERLQIQDIEIGFYKDSTSPFLTVIEWEKDWWEELKIGTLKSGVIKWLKIENLPVEQSILSAQFTDLRGFSNPTLEVYGKTHMGNGSLYLYEIKNDKLLSIFETMAVDFYNENIWSSENYQNYGYFTCGQVYEGGKLSVTYSDINIDGISDILLEGKANIICEKETIKIKASERQIHRMYLWDKNDQKFIESI